MDKSEWIKDLGVYRVTVETTEDKTTIIQTNFLGASLGDANSWAEELYPDENYTIVGIRFLGYVNINRYQVKE